MEHTPLRVYQIGREHTSHNEDVLARALRQIPSSTVLLLTDTDTSQAHFMPDTEYGFTSKPEYSAGRVGGDIRGFGEISISSTSLPVVIKNMSPRKIRHEETWDIEDAIAKEYAIAQELKNSEAPSFNYIGFIKQRNDFLTITEYEKQVENFDTSNQKFNEDKVILALGTAASTLIALHSRGILHDDLTLSNTAYDTRNHQARTIDLSFARHAPRNSVHEFTHNVTDYVTSLGVAKSGRSGFAATRERVENHLIEPYATALSDTIPAREIDKIRQSIPRLIEPR